VLMSCLSSSLMFWQKRLSPSILKVGLRYSCVRLPVRGYLRSRTPRSSLELSSNLISSTALLYFILSFVLLRLNGSPLATVSDASWPAFFPSFPFNRSLQSFQLPLICPLPSQYFEWLYTKPTKRLERPRTLPNSLFSH